MEKEIQDQLIEIKKSIVSLTNLLSETASNEQSVCTMEHRDKKVTLVSTTEPIQELLKLARLSLDTLSDR